ncbi:MAG: hypothetical protein R3D02_09055 [Hyphomicrobiales bacterium]
MRWRRQRRGIAATTDNDDVEASRGETRDNHLADGAGAPAT